MVEICGFSGDTEASQKILNGPFDDDEEDEEAAAAAAADGAEDEDADGKKLPQLAKQESLSSVASSADSGCGNSDINHNGDSTKASGAAGRILISFLIFCIMWYCYIFSRPLRWSYFFVPR